MKQLSLLLTCALLSSSAFAAPSYDELLQKYNELSERMDELETDFESVETKTLTDKINFGLGFNNRYENINYKFGDGSEQQQDAIWSTRLNLNMNAIITESIKFNGRLTAHKYWGNYAGTNQYNNSDFTQGRTSSGSTLYVERAYADFTLTKKFIPTTLTLGRQPSTDGPSHQFKNDSPRKATYSALAFDVNADGAVLTHKLDKLLTLQNTYLRLVYGKAFQTDYRSSQSTPSTEIDSDMYGFFFDTDVPGIKNSLIQLYRVQADDVSVMGSAEIGDVTLTGALVELSNISGSGLSLFMQYAMSDSEKNGNTENGTTMVDGNGHAFWTGLNYKFLKTHSIGAEYNTGSKKWASFTGGSEDLVNKLATRGDAYELYYGKRFNRYTKLRAGYIKQNYDYTGSGTFLGEPTSITSSTSIKEASTFYLSLNLFF